jgi:hypothetical protein
MTVAVNVLRKSLHLMHAQRHWDLRIPDCQYGRTTDTRRDNVVQGERDHSKRYLQHDVGGIVPALGRIKITGQAGRLAVRTNVDFYRRTIDTAETSANNVLLATTSPSEKFYTKESWGNHSLEALDTGVLDCQKEEGVGVNRQGMYCHHLRGSSALSNVPAPSDLSERLIDREGAFTRKAWIG